MRIVFGRLRKERAVELQCAVNLVGRDMVEEFPRPIAVPADPGRLQQRERTHDVGAREGKGILDRTVDVRLGGQMDHAVDPVLAENGEHLLVIADVAPLETVVLGLLDVFQVGQIPRISQLVEIDDAVVGVFGDEKPHDMAPDKTGAARYQNVP